MTKRFRPWDPKQKWLLPPEITEFIPEGHPAHFVRNLVVEELDLTAILDTYVEDKGYRHFRSPFIWARSDRERRRSGRSERSQINDPGESLGHESIRIRAPRGNTVHLAPTTWITGWIFALHFRLRSRRCQLLIFRLMPRGFVLERLEPTLSPRISRRMAAWAARSASGGREPQNAAGFCAPLAPRA